MGLLGDLVEALRGAGYAAEADELGECVLTGREPSRDLVEIGGRALRRSGEFAREDRHDHRERGLYHGR